MAREQLDIEGDKVVGIKSDGALTPHGLKLAKTDYDLHVLLIMRQDKLAKGKATFTAWLEGAAGLVKRLGT